MGARKKLSGWGARIYSGRAAMLGKRGRKMTQQELGDAVGVSAQQIGFYESETNEPNYNTWLKLARALLIAPGALMFGGTHLPIEEGQEKPLERPSQRRGKQQA